jgi:hypothetical protein
MSSVGREWSVTKLVVRRHRLAVSVLIMVGQAVGFAFVISPTMVGADEARRGAGRVLGPCRKAVPIGDHEVEVADTRRVEARIVDRPRSSGRLPE